MEQIKFYTVDLTKINGNGEFNCPECGVQISPDDQTEEIYTILKTITKGNNLDKLILQCNNCRSRIHLIGFQVLTKQNSYLEAITVTC